MSPAWTDSSRLRSSATNHDCNSADDLRTLDDDIASLLGVEDEDDGYSEEEAMDDSVGFKKSLKMPPFVHAKRKLAQLIELMNGPYLELAPHYQRGVVWTRKAMRLLIDSMWKGYYIPPVIFNLELVEDGRDVRFKRTCVDGKQRLTSIRDFMNGEFPIHIDKKAWYFCAPKGRRQNGHNILPDSAREEFKAIEVLCTEYKGLTEAQEIELFQRVQLGTPLTKAEAFRATQGSWQDFAKQYEKDFADVIGLCKKNNRASGFRTLLICFLMIYECVDPAENGVPTLRGSIQAIEAFCSNNTPSLDADIKAHIFYVFEMIHELMQEDRSIFENNNYTKRQVFSPIEFVAVACLISQKGAERPKGMLRGDILALRSHLREIHDDLRISKQCWTTAWKFIDTIESHRGALDGSTVRKKPPKFVKKKPQPQRSAKSLAAVNTESQTPSAKVSLPVTADEDDRPPSNVTPVEQIAEAAGRTPVRNGGREHAMRPDSPNSSSTDGFPSTVNNEGDHTASDRRLSNTSASVPSSMSSIAPRESFTAEPQRPRLSAIKRTWDKSSSERAASQGITISGSETPFTPSTGSPTSGNAAIGHGSMTAPPSRKRLALDLGSGSSGAHELESKKARLMAGYVKQEKDA